MRKISRDLAAALALTLMASLGPVLSATALSPPSNLRIASSSEVGTTPNSASAKVTWAVTAGAVGYTVYATSGGVSIAGSTPSCDANDCISFIQEMVGGVSYDVVISAVNADGGASNSAAVAHTGISVPTAPVVSSATGGNGTAILSWRDPSRIGGQNLLSYFITDNSGRDYVVAAGQNLYTASGLVNGQNYTFEIFAINSTGTSSAAAFQQVSPVGVPTAPARPTLVTISNSVAASWLAPLNGGSAITGYTAQLFKAGVLQEQRPTGAGVLSVTFTGLAAGSYTVRVAAANAQGSSEYSPSSLVVGVGNSIVAQTITFPSIANQVFPGSLNLIVAADSGLTVALVASGDCTVNSQQVVTFTAAGSCQIVARQAGNSSFSAASPVTRRFNLAAASSGNNSTVVTPSPVAGGGGGGGGGSVLLPLINFRTTTSEIISGSAIVEFRGSNLGVVSEILVGGVAAKLISSSGERVTASIFGVTAGTYDLVFRFGLLEFKYVNGLVLTNKGPSSSTSPSPGIPGSDALASNKITIGTFKGFVAIYFKGYQDTRVSIQIAGKWLVVPSIPKAFHRVVRNTGAGFTVNSKIFIDRKLVQEKTLTTR